VYLIFRYRDGGKKPYFYGFRLILEQLLKS
jgi:hypothetical protein